MSAYSLIIGHPHGGGAPVVVSGPEIPLIEQRLRYKERYMTTRSDPDFMAVHLLESRRGIVKKRSFSKPEPEITKGKPKKPSSSLPPDAPPSDTDTLSETAPE